MRLVAALGAAAALAASLPAVAQNAPLELRPGETLLEVDAEGEHFQRPDVMTVSAGVVTVGRTATAATSANAEAATRLIETIRAQGVAAADVRTTMLRVQPQFDAQDEERAEREDRRPRITGYVATNRLEVRVRDIDRAPTILDALLASGANDVTGPEFALSDDTEARRTARRAAIVEATRQAEDYASALGMRITRTLRVSERSARVGEDGYVVVTGSRLRAGQPIEPGEVRTKVRVWVDYALSPR